MNYVAECEITLSKKLEKIFEKGEPAYIYIAPIQGNKGKCQIRFVSPQGISVKDLKDIGDTSLLLKFTEAGFDVPNLEATPPIQNIFSNEATDEAIASDVSKNPKENIVAKITSQTEARIERNQLKQRVEQQAKENVDQPQRKKIILRNYDDVAALLSRLPGIERDLPQISAEKKMDRQAAIAYEKQLNQCAKLPYSLYVKNNARGKLEIQDLEIILSHQQVFDISSVPARKLINSRDFRICMERNLISLATKEMYEQWQKKHAEEIAGLADGTNTAADGRGLKAYGSVDEAGDAMFSKEESTVIEDGMESRFIDPKSGKKIDAPRKQAIVKKAEEVEAQPLDFTNEVQDPNADGADSLVEYVEPGLRDVISTLPEERGSASPLPEIVRPPSKTHKAIQRLEE